VLFFPPLQKQNVFLCLANAMSSVTSVYTGLPVVDILPEKGDAVKVVGCFEEDKA
jgi:hypothetical protein